MTKAKVKGPKSVEHGKLHIAVDSCVLVNPPDPDKPPFIAKVKEIIAPRKPNDETQLRVAWYYRPEEATGGRKCFHGEKEVFASDHMDTILLATVFCKCRVHTLSKYQELARVGETDYFSRFTYRPAKEEFEPDRVPVFCKCEMPYNPDQYMICCDSCEEWYHPECLGMSDHTKDISSFVCEDCRQEAANKRPRLDPNNAVAG